MGDCWRIVCEHLEEEIKKAVEKGEPDLIAQSLKRRLSRFHDNLNHVLHSTPTETPSHLKSGPSRWKSATGSMKSYASKVGSFFLGNELGKQETDASARTEGRPSNKSDGQRRFIGTSSKSSCKSD